MKNNPQHKIRHIRSLHDLKMEKARLKLELVKKEGQISNNWSHLVEAFTFRNLIRRVADDISSTTSVVSSLFSGGKSIFKKFRKKKKEKFQASQADAPPTETVPEG